MILNRKLKIPADLRLTVGFVSSGIVYHGGIYFSGSHAAQRRNSKGLSSPARCRAPSTDSPAGPSAPENPAPPSGPAVPSAGSAGNQSPEEKTPFKGEQERPEYTKVILAGDRLRKYFPDVSMTPREIEESVYDALDVIHSTAGEIINAIQPPPPELTRDEPSQERGRKTDHRKSRKRK